MIVGLVVTAVVLGIAFFALRQILHDVTWADLTASLSSISGLRMAAAALLTAACYLALSGYDRIALRSIGKALPWHRAALASSAAYALSHNLGFAPITASYARHRVYTSDGLGLGDVARVVVLTGAAFWLGIVLMLGVCLIVVPDMVSMHGIAMNRTTQAACGLIVVDLFIGYLLLISRGKREIGIRSWRVPLPSLPDALVQSGISFAEMLLASAVLWILLPSATIADYPLVLVAYVAAFVAVLITHAPGGAGVLEAIILVMLPDLPKAEVLSALIVFRVVFHLIPLGFAIAILAAHRPATGRSAAPKGIAEPVGS